MESVQLGIYLQNMEYAGKIQKYIHQFGQKNMSVYVAENGKELLEKGKIDIWLTDDAMVGANCETPVILMADSGTAEASGWRGRRMDPYTSGRQMLKQLTSHMEQISRKTPPYTSYDYPVEPFFVKDEAKNPQAEGTGGILLSVYSPIGGCGKSTFAMTLCENLALHHTRKKVLYLNLEGAADWQIFFKVDGAHNLSDFLYRMLLESLSENQAVSCMKKMTMRQSNGVYFIEPCNAFEDLNVLKEEEIERLIDVLCRGFDYVVCDLNTAFHSVNQYFLRRSTYRYILLNATVSGQAKLRNYIEGIRRQHLESVILGPGAQFIKVGAGGIRDKGLDITYRELPKQSDLYTEKDGILELKKNTEWYQQVGRIAEEVASLAG